MTDAENTTMLRIVVEKHFPPSKENGMLGQRLAIREVSIDVTGYPVPYEDEMQKVAFHSKMAYIGKGKRKTT